MEVAEQIVVINEGRIEQAGRPIDLYEHPVNEFVMGFVGPVNRVRDALVRPHDVQVLRDPAAHSVEGMVERVVQLGFEARIEVRLANGEPASAQMTRAQAEELELRSGDIVHLRFERPRVFSAA